MPSLQEIVPDVEILLDLPPEELGWALLQDLRDESDGLRPESFVGALFQHHQAYPRQHQQAVTRAIMEAWAWLGREGLIVEDYSPAGPREYFVTRRGREIASDEDFEAYRQARLLPRDLLHPRIAQQCWQTFMSGDYVTAVFKAFKEVEIAVRDAANLSDQDIGVSLMRRAFKPETGVLRDDSFPFAEREALMHLFAGAIGSYKNPHSHRTMTISDPVEAIEMIMVASHLLRIVDIRAGQSHQP